MGGVPEHFNLPWHLARERGLFEKHGVEVRLELLHTAIRTLRLNRQAGDAFPTLGCLLSFLRWLTSSLICTSPRCLTLSLSQHISMSTRMSPLCALPLFLS